MLRALRSISRFATLFGLLSCGLLTAPAFAYGPKLIAEITEPFQVGARAVAPGVLSLKPVSGHHPGASIDELWVGNEFLGLFVADGAPNDARVTHDAIVFERSAQGRLVLVGYVVQGSRSDTEYRYRQASAVSAAEAGTGAARSDRAFTSR